MMPSAENMSPRAFPRGKGQHTIYIPHTTVLLILGHKTQDTDTLPLNTPPHKTGY